MKLTISCKLSALNECIVAIRTDNTGTEHHYPSAAAAARAHGLGRNAMNQAAIEGHRSAGLYWRWEDA